MTVEEILSRLEDAKPGVSGAQLIRLEGELQAQLPADYRAFLARANGGTLGGQVAASFATASYAGGHNNALVERFYGVGVGGDTAVRPVKAYLAEIENLPRGTPEQMICIANDYSGNVVTLDLRPGTAGQVGLIDHELIGDSFDDPEGYQVVAPNFSAFVTALREPELPTSSEAQESALAARWSADNNEGLWVMLAGLVVALVALWLLGGLDF